MADIEKGLVKILTDVAAAKAETSRGMSSTTTPLQQAFGGLDFGMNLTAGGGNSLSSQTGTSPTIQGTNAALELRFKLLKDEVHSLKFGTKSVSMVGQEFGSKAAVAAWIKINCPNDQGYLFRVDVTRFLALAFTVYKDMES